MTTPIRPAQHRQTIRAAALAVLAVGAMAIIWRLRPSVPSATGTPDAAVVLGCAWLAWALAGYLTIAVAANSVGHVIAGFGFRSDPLTCLAPPRLRRLVDMAITLSVATSVLGTGTAASAAETTGHHANVRLAPQPAAGDPLDWPGVATASPSRPATQPPPATSPRPATRSPRPRASALPSTSPSAPPAPSPRHRRADVGLVTSGPRHTPVPGSVGGVVTVKRGDSLWKIAARHLGPAASAESTAIAWHRWYLANREVVGDDPDLIYPGQRLRAPTATVSGPTGAAR